MKTILIDTDIGTDIDDAIALVFAAKSGLQIAAVTTVAGDTTKRAKIAMHLLRLCGLERVPVGAGLAGSLQKETPSQYWNDMEAYQPHTDGVKVILDTVAAHPDITIVTLGPLTNLAACIRQAPELMKQAQLVMMCGMITAAFPEGNIHADPEAAETVFQSPLKKTMIGLDITVKCELKDSDIHQILNVADGPNACLYRMLRRWKRHELAPILRGWGEDVHGSDYPASAGMHDPMAVAYSLWPELFTIRQTGVVVETKGNYSRGLTLEQVNPFRGNHPVGSNIGAAVAVKGQVLMDRFLSVLKSNPPINITEVNQWKEESISTPGTRITTAITPACRCAADR